MPTQLESYNAAKLEPAVYPQDARIEAARLGASLTLTKGQVLGMKSSDKKLYAYNNANSDGTETAVAILMHDVATDSAGKHYLGGSAVAGTLNLPHADTSVYVAGVFDTSQLTGWDAAAKTDFGARTLHNGYTRIP